MTPCPSGKQAYLTAAAAWAVIRRLTSKRALLSHKQLGQSGSHAYRCVDCHQWHITRQLHRHRPARQPPRRAALYEREWRA